MNLIEKEFKETGAGITAIYKKLKSQGVTLSMVKNYFKQSLPEFQKPDKFTNHSLNPIQVSKPFELWEIDLMDMSKAKDNGYAYIMNVIDDFTKRVWSMPLKTKSQKEIESNFLDIVKDAGKSPLKLLSDQEAAITSNEFKTFLEHNDIQWLNLNKSAPTVERFNRTLRGRLEKLWVINKNKKWVDLLPSIITNYNSSYHRTIKTAPNNVKGAIIKKVATELKNRARDIIDKKGENESEFHNYNVNDKVRTVLAGKFMKGSAQKLSTEIYTVKEKIGSYYKLNNGKKYPATKLFLVEVADAPIINKPNKRSNRIDYRKLAAGQ